MTSAYRSSDQASVVITWLLCLGSEILLHAPYYYYLGSFSYTPRAMLCGEFPLNTSYAVISGVSLTHSMLFCVGSFPYTPHATIMWIISLTRPMLYYVGSFSYTPHAVLCGEFLLHAPCCIMWGVSLTRLMQLLCG